MRALSTGAGLYIPWKPGLRYVHQGGVGMGTMGIYNDCVGTVMEDNYFVETSRSVMMGGGGNFTVKNNVFVSAILQFLWIAGDQMTIRYGEKW
ncbi:MAG: hypothetical protein ACLTDS_09535 [Bianqueaceae bacterium]